MFLKLPLAALAALVLPSLCSAQINPLTLDDCVRLAEQAPSAITSARREVDYAGLSLSQARNAYLPTSSIVTGYNYNTPSPSNPSTFVYVSLNAIREYVTQSQMTLNLDTSGRMKAIVDRARADQSAAGANLKIAQRDLRRLVTVSYYQVLLARRLVTVASDVLKEAQSFEQRMRQLEQGGEAARADVVQASSQVAIYRQAVSNAELQAQLANMDLASYWTTDVADRLDLMDVFDQSPGITDTGGLGPAPYRNRPEFSLLDAQRRGFEADSRAIRAQLLPQTSIIWQYGVDMNHINFNEHGQAAMFAVTVPVFDWFRTRNLAAQSRVRADQLATQARIAERAYSRDYQNALARLSVLFQQISFTQQQIAVAEDNLRLSQLKYQGGEGLPLEVLTAQTQVAQARGSYFTALANYHVAQADLEVAAAQ